MVAVAAKEVATVEVATEAAGRVARRGMAVTVMVLLVVATLVGEGREPVLRLLGTSGDPLIRGPARQLLRTANLRTAARLLHCLQGQHLGR